MRIQSNYQQKNFNPHFGLIQFDKQSYRALPEVIELINANAEEVNRLTPENNVFGAFSKELNCLYLVLLRSKTWVGKCIEGFSLGNRAKTAYSLQNPELMPNNAEILDLPITKNALLNTLRKITGNK